jgi:hypothetical protein
MLEQLNNDPFVIIQGVLGLVVIVGWILITLFDNTGLDR